MASTSTPAPEATALTVGDVAAVGRVRLLKRVTAAAEALLHATLAWSLFAFGGVTPVARAGIAVLAASLAILTLWREWIRRDLRSRLGEARIALHSACRWVTIAPAGATAGWQLDLARARWPPVVLPLLALALWSGSQMVVPGGTVDIAASARGLSLLLVAVVVHACASLLATDAGFARRRGKALALVGLALAVASLADTARGPDRFWRQEADATSIPFGPFWYRNHFAAAAVMLVPFSLGHASGALVELGGALSRRGARALLGRHALPTLEWGLPAFALIAALAATTSRGGWLALAVGLGTAGFMRTGRRPRPVGVLLVLGLPACLVVTGLGPASAVERLARIPSDAGGRFLGWRTAVTLAGERPLAGWGLNAYPAAVSAHAGLRERLERVHPHLAFAAHNDYLQLAAETGLVGGGLALWVAGAAVSAARRDSWRLAAVIGGLVHAGIDFLVGIPGLVVLFTLVASPGAPERRREQRARDPGVAGVGVVESAP